MRKADNLPPYRAVNFLEPSGPAQAVMGELHFTFYCVNLYKRILQSGCTRSIIRSYLWLTGYDIVRLRTAHCNVCESPSRMSQNPVHVRSESSSRR